MQLPYLTELAAPIAGCNGLWSLNGTLPIEYAHTIYENEAEALRACLEAIAIVEAYIKARGV